MITRESILKKMSEVQIDCASLVLTANKLAESPDEKHRALACEIGIAVSKIMAEQKKILAELKEISADITKS